VDNNDATTAWLIESPGGQLCIGVCNREAKWGSADLAIRFCREEDAIAVRDLLKIKDAKVTEHSWW